MRARERRRLVLATALTVAAFPALWLLDGGNSDDGAAATVTTTQDPQLPVGTEGPGIPVFLDNTAPVAAPAVIDIAVPESPGTREARGSATFKRFVDAPVERPCTTALAPPGVMLTVTNVDNGTATTCMNTRSTAVPPGSDIAIDTSVYIIIAELVEAPVPVRISW